MRDDGFHGSSLSAFIQVGREHPLCFRWRALKLVLHARLDEQCIERLQRRGNKTAIAVTGVAPLTRLLYRCRP
jgi:hypothetical protein